MRPLTYQVLFLDGGGALATLAERYLSVKAAGRLVVHSAALSAAEPPTADILEILGLAGLPAPAAAPPDIAAARGGLPALDLAIALDGEAAQYLADAKLPGDPLVQRWLVDVPDGPRLDALIDAFGEIRARVDALLALPN